MLAKSFTVPVWAPGNGMLKNLGCESRLLNLNIESVLVFIAALFTIAPN